MFGVIRNRTISYKDGQDSRLDSDEKIKEIIVFADDSALTKWILEHHSDKSFEVVRLTPIKPTINVTLEELHVHSSR